MKKAITTFLIFLSITSLSYAQSGWVVLHPFNVSDYYASVFFLNAETGFCAGSDNQDFPIIIRTTNSGQDWTRQSFLNLQYSNLEVVYFVNSLTGFCSGYQGLILKTTNQGQNWIEYAGPIVDWYSSISFVDINTGYIAGATMTSPDTSIILKTYDGGIHWTRSLINNMNYYLHSIKFFNSNLGFVCGYRMISDTMHGALYRSTNGGNSWSFINCGLDASLFSICFTDNNTGYIIGKDGIGWNNYINKILKSTNAGLNWFELTFNTSNYNDFDDVKFAGLDTGYVIGGRGPNSLILKTINAGSNWFEQNGGVESPLLSCSVVNSNIVFISGWDGVVLKTTNGGNPIGIQPVSGEIPDKYNLFQNYPNPFNPSTMIKFDIPANVKGQMVNVKLIIYDILGRKVATLVNEQLKPGSYEAEWDGINYASGIYFYSLQTEQFTQTKKMVLFK